MNTEEEEYYDSIDDTEFESCRSFCNAKFQDEDSDGEEDAIKGTLVPFYNGNIDVNSIKNDSKSNSSTNLKNRLKVRNNRHLIPTPHTLYEKRKNRSYLTMFYAKSGLQKKAEIPETCVDLSPKSIYSCELAEKTPSYFDQGVEDSESFYDRYIEQEDAKDKNYTSGNLSIACMSSSRATLDTKLYSASEVHFNSLEVSKKNSSNEIKKNKRRAKPVKVTELGGLGPNIAQDKLELLRRRQDYGKVVSEKNRIKIMEHKVVQKLKQEIQESNKF